MSAPVGSAGPVPGPPTAAAETAVQDPQVRRGGLGGASEAGARNADSGDSGAQDAGADVLTPEVDEIEVVFDKLVDLWESLLRATPLIALAVLVLVLTWIVTMVTQFVLGRVMRPWRIRRSLKDLIRQLVMIAVWVAGILVAANVMFPSLTPAKTLTALGVGSIAIGFAFKDIFENFFAGALILWRFPFEPGDFIRCGEIMGRVEGTTVRMTLVRQTDGRLLVVPNATLFKTPVEILTWRRTARIEATVGISYGDSLVDAKRIIERTMREMKTVSQDEPIDVQTEEFASSSVNIRLLWWTGARPAERRASVDEVLTSVKTALEAEGMYIPFPQRVLTFANPVEVGGAPPVREVSARAPNDESRPGDRRDDDSARDSGGDAGDDDRNGD